eukprot:6189585-Pleurochrysis_carterae.AAC.3
MEGNGKSEREVGQGGSMGNCSTWHVARASELGVNENADDAERLKRQGALERTANFVREEASSFGQLA